MHYFSLADYKRTISFSGFVDINVLDAGWFWEKSGGKVSDFQIESLNHDLVLWNSVNSVLQAKHLSEHKGWALKEAMPPHWKWSHDQENISVLIWDI